MQLVNKLTNYFLTLTTVMIVGLVLLGNGNLGNILWNLSTPLMKIMP